MSSTSRALSHGIRPVILLALGVVSMSDATAAERLSFHYADGQPAADAVHVHTTSFPRLETGVFIYCTFEMSHRNPVHCPDGNPRAVQTVTLGQMRDGEFVAALRFGISDNRNRPTETGYLTPWVSDGRLDYYGGYARPDTPYDFRAQIDLKKTRATVWCCGRGDDSWFLLAENVPLIALVTAIDEVRVEQHPDAPGVRDLVIQGQPWDSGKALRPHPRAKKERLVTEDGGFRFQPMRSVWRLPGRHVTIGRKPPVWMGFPDVVQVDSHTLVCTHNDGVGHGGGGRLLVRRSEDLGHTWSDPVAVFNSGINCPRLQKLSDGSLLLLADVGGNDPVLFDSLDGGKTWINQRIFDPLKCGGNQACVPSRVTELPDGSWLLVGSWYPGGMAWKGSEGERLEFFRSTDRGATWRLHSFLHAYPPHSLSEASVLVLPDKRLMLYAREARSDGHPGVKAFSSDNGKTWGPAQDLPFAITGRTCAGFLKDGRVILTFRSGIGRSALWAWVGRADDATDFRIAGAHIGDSGSVALGNGALAIDSDSACGQFTQYFLRPPDSPESAIDLTVEMQVRANAGRAATLSIPFVGRLRLFPDHVELAHDPAVRIPVTPHQFHTYRIVRAKGVATLFVDGHPTPLTDKVDARTERCAYSPTIQSIYPFAFGNEPDTIGASTNVYLRQIAPEVTGCSLWRRIEVTLDDPQSGKHALAWSASRDGFPDQYQLDHIVEIDATVEGHDQGYSGWVELEDGRIFFTNYTDDTAPTCPPTGVLQMGVSWIRGTFVLPPDLPH